MKKVIFLLMTLPLFAGALAKGFDLRLHIAAADGDLPKVERLLKGGLSANLLDENQYPALYFAFDQTSEELALVLLEKMDLSLKVGPQKESLLLAAIRKNQMKSVQFLLLKKPELLKQKAAENMTPLMIAARFSTPEIVKALLDAGASAQDRNSFGTTALEMAQKAQNKAVVDLLLQHQNQAQKKK